METAVWFALAFLILVCMCFGDYKPRRNYIPPGGLIIFQDPCPRCGDVLVREKNVSGIMILKAYAKCIECHYEGHIDVKDRKAISILKT